MAISAIIVATSTTATAVYTPVAGMIDDPTPIIVQNTSSATSINLGGPNVTSTANGFPLAAGASLPLRLINGDILYAASTAGTPNLAVLLGRQ